MRENPKSSFLLIVGNTRSFTLIEIVIALFIVALILSAVLPSFHDLTSRGMSSDARIIASMIRYLNDTSQNTKTEALMILNLDMKTVSYTTGDREESRDIDSLYAVKLTSAEERILGEVTVLFPASGLTERLRVRLFNGVSYMAVIYNPFSGGVTVQEETEIEKDRHRV